MTDASLSLPPEEEAFVQDQVRSGAFADREALFREAVRLLHETVDEQRQLVRLDARLQQSVDRLDRGEGETVADLNGYFDDLQVEARRG